MVVGGAIIDVLRFSRSNFLFRKLDKGSKEEKRQNNAPEKLTRDRDEYIKHARVLFYVL